MFGIRPRQNGTYHAIGFDLGSDAVKLLQLRTPPGGATEVSAAARVPLPQAPGLSPALSQAAVLAAIRDALRSSPFVGRRVVASLPRRIVHVRAVRISPSDAIDFDPVTAAEREAAAGLFPFPLPQARVAYLPAGEVRHAGEVRQEVVVAAAAETDVTAFLDLLAAAGLTVDGLELEQTSLYRAAERAASCDSAAAATAAAEPQAVRVLLDLGASATQIVIGRGGELCVVKTLPIGVRRIEEQVARRLSVSTDDVRSLRTRLTASSEPDPGAGAVRQDPVRRALHDALRLATSDLLEQVLLCIRYYTVSFRGRPPARVWVTGGGAEGADFCELARSALALPVEPLPLMAGVPLGPLVALDNTAPLGEWAVAYGLALRNASAHEGPSPLRAPAEVVHA